MKDITCSSLIFTGVDKEGESTIMLDDSIGIISDNIWEICYKSGFQEDENGDKISLLNQNKKDE